MAQGVCDKKVGRVDRPFYLPYNLIAYKLTEYKEVIMEHTIERLQQKKRSLLRKIGEIGNFRRGTISVNYRKCGKKNCICTKEGHPGHGPQYLWSTTLKGKSYTKNLKLGSELQKYKEEIDNYHRFQRLCNDIIKINEEICDLQPVAEIKDAAELDRLKKNLQKYFAKKYKKKLIE